MNHGFLRTPDDGTITTFDAPGAGTGPSQGTLAEDINPEGVIAGEYSDASNVVHGFLRTEDGAFTTFDVSGAGTGPARVPLLQASKVSPQRERSRDSTPTRAV